MHHSQHTSNSSNETPPRRTGLTARFAVGILFFAALAWGSVLFWQVRRGPAQRHIDAGNAYAQQGDGPNAVREWTAATKEDPDNIYAWQVLGQTYFDAKRWDRAREAYTELLRLSPETPRIRSLLASCYFHLGDLDAALKGAREELKRYPNDIASLETCVAVQTRLGDALEMTRCLRRLTELEPNKVAHHVALAHALISQNNVVELLPVTERILEINPEQAEMYALRGLARFHTDGTTDGMARAEKDFHLALARLPNQYESQLYLGRIYKRRGSWKIAASYLNRAAELKPKKADAYFDLAAAYEHLGQMAKAAAARKRFQSIVHAAEHYLHLKKRCDTNPKDAGLHIQVGLLAIQRDDLPAADHYLSIANALRPRDPRVIGARQQLAVLEAKARSAQPADPHTPVARERP